MRKFELEDPRRIHQAREALRSIERQREVQHGTALSPGATLMATPGKATLTGALGAASLGPELQLSRTLMGAAADVANLEQANRSGNFDRASWARASIVRFLDQLPWLLAAVSRGAQAAVAAQVHEILARAEVAIDNAPKISQAANEAADRGDFSLLQADLAPWYAKAHTGSHDVATGSRELATSSQNVATGTRKLTLSLRNAPTTARGVASSSQNVASDSRELTVSSRNAPTTARDVASSSRELTVGSRNVPTTARDVASSSRELTVGLRNASMTAQEEAHFANEATTRNPSATSGPSQATTALATSEPLQDTTRQDEADHANDATTEEAGPPTGADSASPVAHIDEVSSRQIPRISAKAVLPSMPTLRFGDFQAKAMRHVLSRVGTHHRLREATLAAANPEVAARVSERALGPRRAIGAQHATPQGRAMWGAAQAHAVTLYRRAVAGGSSARETPEVAAAFDALGSGGPLPAAVRQLLEERLGTSLEGVRLHTGAVAREVAAAIDAEAFTVGEDIFFPGFDPASSKCLETLAHECVHVMQFQQGRTPTALTGPTISKASDPLEQEAESVVARAFRTSTHIASDRPTQQTGQAPSLDGAHGSARVFSLIAGPNVSPPARSDLNHARGSNRAAPFVQLKRASSSMKEKSSVATESRTGSAATFSKADIDEETLPESVSEFAVASDGWSALVRTEWVTKSYTENILKVLRQMQRSGAFTWAKEEGLRRAAENAPRIDERRKVVRYLVDLRALARMGLPPLSGAMVAREGDDLVIAMKIPGVKDDSLKESHPLRPDDARMVCRAVEKFTGLAVKTHPQFHGLVIRDGIMEVYIDDAQAAAMFGPTSWDDWKKRPSGAAAQSESGHHPVDVSSELSLSEKMHVESWLKANLGLVDSGPMTHIDRSTLNVIDDIEKNPDLKPIIKQLIDRKTTAPGRVAGTFALEELLEAGKTERDRHRLGTDKLDQGNATPLDASANVWDIDGRIVQKGLVFADREMTFTLELDWELWKTGRSADDIDLFSKRASHYEIEWAVERTDKPGKTEVFKHSHDRSNDIKLDHTFKLGPGEPSGQFKVHAFMRSSHFVPKHLTAVIEVKTEEARMDELRARDLGDMMDASTMMMNYEFDIGTGQKILGPVAGKSRDTNGYAISGPLPKDFKRTDPQQRKQALDDQIDVQRKMVEYLRQQAKVGKVGYGDAIAAAEKRIEFLKEAKTKLSGDETSGWKPFEVRGTYLSRNGEVKTGALELFGNYRISMSREPAGVIAPDELPFQSAEERPRSRPRFEVMIRDVSNKLESDLEFPGDGEHFDDALRDAFVKLAKAYPDGKVSVLAEDFALDNGLGKPNGRSIGYELATTSAWGRVKSKVYDPVVQVLTNAAAMAVMVVFPPSAAVILPMLAVTDIVNNIDHMVSNRDKGKLTFQNASIDLLTIGLDVLPALRGAKLLNPARSAIQEAKGLVNMRLVLFDAVQFGGQFIVMYERTKEQLVDIQDKQISTMAEKYRALIALEKEVEERRRNESDPALRQMRADIEVDAKAIRDTVITTWTEAVQHQATFFVGSHLVGGHEAAAAGHKANRDTHFERKVPREVTSLRKTAANTFETTAESLRVVHAHYEGEGVQTSAITYDHESGRAHFEVTDKTTGIKTRIEAPVGGDNSVSEPRGVQNKDVGNPVRMPTTKPSGAVSEHTVTPQEAIDLLLDRRHSVDEKIKMIDKLEKDGQLRADEANALRADANAEKNVIKSHGILAIQARAAGLEPVVDGARRWSGDQAEIMTMMGKAQSLGIDVRIIERGNSLARWRVRFGTETLEFDERASGPKTPVDLSAQQSAEVRKWADDLANSNPKKMTPQAAASDLEAYTARVNTVAEMYDRAMAGEIATPSGISKERLTQAVKGDSGGERIPLTYGADPVEAKRTFHELQAELQALLDSEGITDAVIVQLGSATTGWSTAPGKTGKPWSSASDVDFAIFSDQILAQAQAIGAKINPKNAIGDQYTTLRNSKEQSHSFEYTPVGAKLKRLTQDWNRRIYGEDVPDGFDFKINLQTDHPFRNAVPVIQMETPVPLTPGTSGGTHAIEIEGRSPYFGVPVQAPKMAGRLPVKTVNRRDFHITILSPPEFAALPPATREELARGLDIPGKPRGRSMERHDIGDMANFQMEVEWPEAQAFRRRLGLAPNQLHVSLNGGIGKAIEVRNANQSEKNTTTPNGHNGEL